MHCTRGWLPPALAMLNLALAPSTWHHYCSSLICFRDFCWQELKISFLPDQCDTVSTIANFIEWITCLTGRPAATINMMLAAINTLYEPLSFKLMDNPLLHCLQ